MLILNILLMKMNWNLLKDMQTIIFVIGTVATGKHPVYTIVIDGVNYKLEKLEKE